MKIGWIGLGKLGLPSALAAEALGAGELQIVGYDVDKRRREIIESRFAPGNYEQGLPELLDHTRLELVGEIAEVVAATDELIFVAVQTPHDPRYGGEAVAPHEPADFDYRWLREVAAQVNEAAIEQGRRVTLVVISTALPGTMRREVLPLLDGPVRLIYNPFFIAMGTTIADFIEPEFVLIGTDDAGAREDLAAFYRTLYGNRHSIPLTWADVAEEVPPILTMRIEEAELAKVAYNTFVSMKIVFANTLGEIADKLGTVDVDVVTSALGQAHRRLVSSMYMTAGVGDGGACFPPGEVVMTEHGSRPIETINVGDRVLTLDGTLQPVLRTWQRDYDGELVTVQAQGLPPARMTADHPVMARLDLRERYPYGRKRTDVFPRSAVAETAAAELTTDHLLTWPTPDVAAPDLPEHATAEYLELAGWYLSEGSAELSVRRGRLRWDLHIDEAAEAERIAELAVACAPTRVGGRGANAKITIEIEPAQNKRAVRLGSIGLARHLVGDFGSGAAAKRLPSWALWGDEKTAALVLRGMILGDGHINDHGIAFSTISRDLAWGAFTLITKLGVRATLRDIPPRVSASGQRHQRAYEVRVRNRREARQLAELVGLPFAGAGEREVAVDDWRPVRAVTRSAYRGPVHNLWVAGTNTYVVASGAVHNCHPRDNIAMSYLARELDLSIDPFRFVTLAREAQSHWLANRVQRIASAHELPIIVLGKAYKPESTLTFGSPAALLVNQLITAGAPVQWWDPLIDITPCPTGPDGAPAVYVVMTRHEVFTKAGPFSYPSGSILVDPFRYLPEPADNVTVVALGVPGGMSR